eukprot:CCRYP_016954-RA/>CCRYP_016954-RA protein AED:0.85 eAED:1.00 QI:0/-1/0/1/-1/1/1/0/60
MPTPPIATTRPLSSASASHHYTASKPHANCLMHPLTTPPPSTKCHRCSRTPHPLQTSAAH